MLYEFSYESPGVKNTLYEILAEKGEYVKLLAGGTDLLTDIRSGIVVPQIVVDIKKIKEYHTIAYDESEGLTIGAAVRCIDVMKNRLIREKFALIAEAAGKIGSPQVRNRATIVGNLCSASPSADMAPVLLCLEASLEIASKRGLRKVSLKDFFVDVKKTVLQKDEIVERIVVPLHMVGATGAMEKLKRIKGHDLSLVSVAMIKKGKLMKVAIGACAPTPLILKDFDDKATIEEIEKVALETIRPIDDIRASALYRKFMVGIYIRRLRERLN